MKARRSPGAVVVSLLGLTTAMGPNHTVAQTLAVGGEHVCVITTTGGVKCWGGNGKGQLGYEDTDTRGNYPETMGDALGYVDLGTNRTAVSIAAGDQHTCAILDNATLKCWGNGSRGRLGQGNMTNFGSTAGTMGDALPIVNLGSGRTASKVVGGPEFTCVLLDDASVVCFGENESGQLGAGHQDDVGRFPGEMGDALVGVDLGSDTHHAVDLTSGPCVRLENGRVKCWGANLYGSTGVPGQVDVGITSGEMGDSLPPIPLGTDLSATSIASGFRHNCAVVRDGDVKCWGKNTQGNLGLGDIHDRGDDDDELGNELPLVQLGLPAVVLDAGDDHTCALLRDSSVKCWGYNFWGSLGLDDFRARGDYPGEMGDSLPTVNLGRDAKAVQICAGGKSSCAVLEGGSVKCWGHGDKGKLGQGHNKNIGDETDDMPNLEAVDLGTGVLVAPVVLPTPAPTPLVSTSTPIVLPTPTPISVPSSVPSPVPSFVPVASSTVPPIYSPIASQDEMGTVEPTSTFRPEQTPPPDTLDEAGSDDERGVTGADLDGSNDSDHEGFNWAIITAVVVAPFAITAIGIGLWSVHKGRRSPSPSRPLQTVPV